MSLPRPVRPGDPDEHLVNGLDLASQESGRSYRSRAHQRVRGSSLSHVKLEFRRLPALQRFSAAAAPQLPRAVFSAVTFLFSQISSLQARRLMLQLPRDSSQRIRELLCVPAPLANAYAYVGRCCEPPPTQRGSSGPLFLTSDDDARIRVRTARRFERRAQGARLGRIYLQGRPWE